VIDRQEIWKSVPDFEGYYEVSSFGNIRSFDRIVEPIGREPYLLPGRVLRTQSDKDGYRLVTLTVNRVRRTLKVHRIVAQVFVPNPDNLPLVDHKDGTRDNNVDINLRWVDWHLNSLDAHMIRASSGFRGVRRHRDGYQAYCHDHVRSKFVHIGVYSSMEAAVTARALYIAERSDVSAR
jgi:hypothetical protein